MTTTTTTNEPARLEQIFPTLNSLYIGLVESKEYLFWPPRVVWSRERGWLNVQDPVDGTWHCIRAKDAPSGWARLASEAKNGSQAAPWAPRRIEPW